jgi:hypothetical protein
VSDRGSRSARDYSVRAKRGRIAVRGFEAGSERSERPWFEISPGLRCANVVGAVCHTADSIPADEWSESSWFG